MKKALKVLVIIIVAITSPIWCVPALFYLLAKSAVEELGWFDDSDE